MFSATPSKSDKVQEHSAAVQKAPVKAIDFHGAAIVDSDGREIPITEAMVQQALNSLARSPQTRQQRN